MHSKTKEIFLKRQAKEFKARALEVNKSSKEILVKGKSLIEEMESKWRRASVTPSMNNLPRRREESPPIVVVEAEVIAKANRINDIVGRLSRDMDIYLSFEKNESRIL
ncbi:Hypothetical protein FKW44_011897 [Caligus rogercresseyi]|uniref:Uncharacterized protein n=1 Tax=Caligus rogercresseyi TaxID=217165 RepID=A0A7T8HIK3_CALRO|nr:Hypothetical protein FKW44_011897 [Caligus rogercresseyi]